ncbi:hypothetical protein E4T42_01971 [Aureobasidium subglaciale]|nr:hypothetical protein E4T42_01971 [Aureobasidium subglaciale]
MPPKRMTANPTAPLRYRPGKAVGAEESSSEEESGSESETEQQPQKTTSAPPKATSFPKFNSNISKADLERRRQEAQALRAREAELAKQAQEGFETASESEDSGSEEDSASEADSDDEESEDEAPTRRFVAPTFISKAQRKTVTTPKQSEEEAFAQEERKRQEKADALLQAQLEKEAAERALNRRAWDDEDPDAISDVDDTDNIDPEAELAAWKLRELHRVKRERETIESAEKEREEIERRRNLTAEQREAEDSAHLATQKEEKDARGQAGFMQKYHHKGAFFQDDEEFAELANRDIMGAKFQDDSGNREILPQYMQIRDMTKLGRKGRTKYKDLKAEDTGRWGAEDDRRGGPGYGGDRYTKDREGATGANASVVGERRRRDDDRGGEAKRPRYD